MHKMQQVIGQFLALQVMFAAVITIRGVGRDLARRLRQQRRTSPARSTNPAENQALSVAAREPRTPHVQAPAHPKLCSLMFPQPETPFHLLSEPRPCSLACEVHLRSYLLPCCLP